MLGYDKQGHVVTITMNRPHALNAINGELREALNAAWLAFRDDPDAWVAILTGAGRAFCAGADLRDGAGAVGTWPGTFWEIPTINSFESGLELYKPVIAAVNGHCIGYGFTGALACDFIYAADTARFGQPEVNLGLMPGFGGTQRLSRRVGPARARELVYTADMVKADAALAMGLVNAVVPAAELLEKVRAVAEKITSKAPIAVASSKRVMVRAADADLPLANELEATAFCALFDSEDMRAGTRAFVEKRAAKFQGK